MQRFSMIPADCQAPLRVCYSHDMSRHPIERIEASSGQFLRNWAFCDPYFAVFYYRKSPFCPTLEQYFPMCTSDSQAPLRVCYSHDMSRHPIERIEASSGQFLRNWAFCDPYFAVFYYRKSPFCPTLEQYFPMCTSDSQAPLRICYSHDMSRHPIESDKLFSKPFIA